MFKKLIGTFGTRFLNIICGFITLLVGTHQLGAEQWGIGATILLDVSLSLLLVELIAGPGLIYYASRIPFAKLFKISWLWTAAVCVLLFAVFYVIRCFFPIFYDTIVPEGYGLITLGLVFIYGIHNFNMKLLLGKERVGTQNVLLIIQFVVQFLSMLLFVFVFDIHTADAFVYSLLSGYTSGFVVGTIIVLPYMKNDGSEDVSIWSAVRNMMNFGIMIQLSSIVTMLNRRLSYYVIRRCTGMSDVGIYGSATQISEATKVVPLSIAMVQFSVIANMNDEKKAAELTIGFLKISVLVTFLAMIVICLLPVEFYEWLLTKDFSGVRDIIIALAPGMVLMSANMIFSHFFSGTNRPKYNFIGSLVGFAMTALSVYPLIYFYGYVGAGVSMSLTYLAATVYKWFVFKKLTNITLKSLIPTSSDFTMVKNEIRNSFMR